MASLTEVEALLRKGLVYTPHHNWNGIETLTLKIERSFGPRGVDGDVESSAVNIASRQWSVYVRAVDDALGL